MVWSSFISGLAIGISITALIAGYWVNWLMAETIKALRETNEVIDSNTKCLSAILRAGDAG